MDAKQSGQRKDTRSFIAEDEVEYEKPLFEEQVGMNFTQQILEKFNQGRFCVQCSGCHGCR